MKPERKGGVSMFVSIRDDVVLHGGFRSVADGLKFLELEAVEVNVRRDLTVRSLTENQLSFRLDHDKGLSDFERELSNKGIRVCAFLLGNDFGKPDVDDQILWMTKTVEVAHRLGVPVVRVDAVVSGWEKMGMEKAVKLFAENVKRVLDATENTSVELGIENHGALGNRPEFLQAVFEAVGSQRLGLTLDTGNFYWFGHPLSRVYEIMQQFATKVKHTHIKNISYPQELREQKRQIGYEYGKFVSPIPDGDIDHSRVVAILQAAGYKGDLCVEDESLGKFALNERPQVLRRDVDYLKALIV